MNKKRVLILLIALLVACAGLAVWAVSAQIRVNRLEARLSGADEAAAPQAQAQLHLPEGPDAVAAEFNGGTITAQEAATEYAVISEYYRMLGMNEAEYAENAKYSVLESLVEARVLEQKARELGVFEMSDEERAALEARVQAEYEDNLRYYMEFRFDESKSEDELRAETIEYLNENGSSYADMLAAAERSAWQDRLFEKVTSEIQISDEQMREFYQTQLESAELTYSADYNAYEADAEAGRTMVWNPEGVRRVDSIFIPFDEAASVEYLSIQAAVEGGDASRQADLDALYAQLEPSAQAVIDRLNAGEDFAALQAEYGALSEYGCFVSDRSDVWGDAFREAAMALAQPGDLSAPVRVDGGICILRYAADVPAGPVAFEAVRDALLDTYEAELKTSQYNATVVQWVQAADAKYYIDRF